jgi:tetratricopeptide (TPR) repeat protein
MNMNYVNSIKTNLSLTTVSPFLKSVSLVLGALFVISCASRSEKKVVELSDNGQGATLQLSRDSRSTLFLDVTKEAQEARAELLARKEVSQELLNSIAELSLLAGNPDDAAKEARELLKKDLKNMSAMRTLVKVQIARNRPEQALLIAENALRDNARDADMLGLQGLGHFISGDLLAARSSWKKGVDANPSHIPSLMNLGVLYYQNRNLQLSGSYFEKVLALQSQNSDALIGKALVLSGQGQWESAKVLLTELLQSSPKSQLALYNLAIIEKERFKNFDLALGYTERYLAVVKNNRVATEKFIAQREELKGILAKKSGPVTDEQLRKMAQVRSSSASDEPVLAVSVPAKETEVKQEPGKASAVVKGGVDVNTNDEKSLEDAIK